MPSTSETGHAVNIANFKKLIDYCTSYGAAYNPSNTELSLANMNTLWTSCNTSHSDFITAKQGAKEPINSREQIFKPLTKLVTRVVNSLGSTKASTEVKKDAKGLADDVRGKNKNTGNGKKKETNDADVNFISQSHQSYVQRADRFLQLTQLLGTVTDYTPNETDLKMTALNALYGNLKTANDGMGTVIANVSKALVDRNKAMYVEDTGLFWVAKSCKLYVKSLYGASSPEYKMISGIAIKNLG